MRFQVSGYVRPSYANKLSKGHSNYTQTHIPTLFNHAPCYDNKQDPMVLISAIHFSEVIVFLISSLRDSYQLIPAFSLWTIWK